MQRYSRAPLPGQILPARLFVQLLQKLPGQLKAVQTSGIDRQEIIGAASEKDPVAAAAAEAYGRTRPRDARAIVAAVLAEHRGDAPGTEPRASRGAATREALVDTVLEALWPAIPRGIGGWSLSLVLPCSGCRRRKFSLLAQTTVPARSNTVPVR
jgi:hypothetical protein